jgi:hypothetical protein
MSEIFKDDRIGPGIPESRKELEEIDALKDRLRKENDDLTPQVDALKEEARSWRSGCLISRDREQKLEEERDTLKNKIEEYESRPWPGCHMLSLGDKCECSLCRADREIARLRACLKEIDEIVNRDDCQLWHRSVGHLETIREISKHGLEVK